MEFVIDRTSAWDDEIPYEEAILKEVIETDERTVDSPEKLPDRSRDHWYDSPWENHRVENGHIKRDRKINKWTIIINSLEELMNFTLKCGNQIILSPCETYNLPEIEIYDEYRE